MSCFISLYHCKPIISRTNTMQLLKFSWSHCKCRWWKIQFSSRNQRTVEHLVFTLDKEQLHSNEMKEKLMHFECTYSHSMAYLAEIICHKYPNLCWSVAVPQQDLINVSSASLVKHIWTVLWYQTFNVNQSEWSLKRHRAWMMKRRSWLFGVRST